VRSVVQVAGENNLAPAISTEESEQADMSGGRLGNLEWKDFGVMHWGDDVPEFAAEPCRGCDLLGSLLGRLPMVAPDALRSNDSGGAPLCTAIVGS